MLFLRAEAHHVFHTQAVIPTAVEDHDFARGGEVLHVALHVHLRLLAVGRRGQRHQPEHARADAFGDGLDGAALAGGIAALEDDDDAQALVLDPFLQLAELALELAQFLLVFLALQFLSPFGFEFLLINDFLWFRLLRLHGCRFSGFRPWPEARSRRLPATAQGTVERDDAEQFVELGLGQVQLGGEQFLFVVEHLQVAGHTAIVADVGQVGGLAVGLRAFSCRAANSRERW